MYLAHLIFRFRLLVSVVFGVAAVAACTPLSPNTAQRAAQPKVPAARNFTSFSASLRCMDNLLASANLSQTLISSTGIPDLTKKLAVGADDMLLNAVNQMNRKSKSYLFVDQSLEREVGQISIFTTKESDVSPKLYIRGAISQIDSNTASSKLKLDANYQGIVGGDLVRSGDKTIGRGLTVVTVDMHLVSLPSKTVVPGSSVANSMVVTSRSFGLGASGLIDVTALDASLTIDRVESLGQAVRNLVELGTIELIGRHANVPYWECLNIPAVKQRLTNRKEIVFSSADKPFRIPEVQRMMMQLGYFSGEITGVVDQRTRSSLSRFQASNGLIATGDLNYDTYQQLSEKTKGFAPRRRITPAPVNPREPVESSAATNKIIAPKRLKKSLRKLPRASVFGGLFSKKPVKELNLKSTKQQYQVGDIWQAYVILPRNGFLSCFYQTNSGPIVQILPSQPNKAFQGREGQEIMIPDPRDAFDIKFEKRSAREKILCLLETSADFGKPAAIAAKTSLAPVSAKSFEQIISVYRTRSPTLLWGQIQESG